MAHLVFAAHDPGGANMLLPVMALARDHGHRTVALGVGPAAAIWRRAGEDVETAGAADGDASAAALRSLAPDLAVTATGTTDFERVLWRAAGGAGIRALAAIDAWSNLRRRFTDSAGGLVQPDAVGVVDEAMRDLLAGEGWCRARLHVTGQPHLEAVVRRLERKRTAAGRARGAETGPPVLAFFSEPLRQDNAGPGFDQYDVINALVPALAGHGPLTLTVQPHPREDRGEVERFLGHQTIPEGIAVRIGDADTETLLAACDGVIGMTTMVLIEAALAGIPALSLQPGRTRISNPGVEGTAGIRVVADGARVASEIAAFLSDLDRRGEGRASRPTLLDGAARRFLEAIHKELEIPAPAARRAGSG